MPTLYSLSSKLYVKFKSVFLEVLPFFLCAGLQMLFLDAQVLCRGCVIRWGICRGM